ncbi:hypothetical protein [Pseudonocardia sp.]|uniref:hypothetical protein n=1 Tax=Pseudonocardia sp. TaxID=60912 RepID=UPI0031FE0EFD
MFLDAFVNATRAAQATHQQEKLAALRNAVVNSVAPDAPNVDQQARFFRLADQFSAAHLALLGLLDDPVGAERAHTGRTPSAPGSLGDLMDYVLSFRPSWRDLLLSDLADARLVIDVSSPYDVLSDDGHFARQTTALGRQFLHFISESG